MKRILCYGDSNTYGCDARRMPIDGTMDRYDENTRWPCLLQKILGDGWYVCEAGMNGRTTVFEDPVDAGRCGIATLDVVFKSAAPVDLVIVMLGTNDIKDQFSASAQVIAWGMERLLVRLRELISESLNPQSKILLIAPANVRASADGTLYYDMTERSVKKGEALPALYAALAEKYGCLFADAGQWVEPDPSDGVHLGVEGHRIFAEHAAEIAKGI
jgi:lysophospholipase L1-like esterase